MPTPQQGMWTQPLRCKLQQAVAASRHCCTRALHAHRPHMGFWRQQQHQLRSATACTALLSHAHQQPHVQQQHMCLPQAASALQQQQQWRQKGINQRTVHHFLTPGCQHACWSSSTAAAASASVAADSATAAPQGPHAAAEPVKSTATAAAAAGGAQQSPGSSSSKPQASRAPQTLDYTTLVAACHELASNWVPAKVEEVRRRHRYLAA